MLLYRYSRWDGSQEVFPISGDELMEQLAEHLMGHADVSSALRAMLQRGLRGRYGQRVPGLQEMLQRLRQARQQALDRYDLSSVLEEIRSELEGVVSQEREGIHRRLEEMRHRLRERRRAGQDTSTEEALLARMERMAQRNLAFLDHLPQEPAGRLGALKDYEFMDPGARERFQRLLERLQRRILEQFLRDLTRQVASLTPDDLQAIKEMVRELNRLLEERAQGGQPAFQQFLQRYGHLFGPNPPSTLDDLVEGMQRRIAQMESLLDSLSPEQRRQLQRVLESAFRDRELQAELERLAVNLEYLHPMGGLRRDYPFRGEEPLTLEQALQVMEHLQRIDELERQLKRAQQSGQAGEVDRDLLREVLGEDLEREMEQLAGMARVLEEAGYIQRVGNRYELTPKGMRRIGQKALQEIFAYIRRDRAGQHPSGRKGLAGERTEETGPYEYGRPFDLDLPRSLFNALARGARGTPLQLRPQDLEVYHRRERVHSSTVLMIDLSLSMAMRGNFLAAKKVALALDNLIRTQFPRDTLYIVGFSTYAREVKPEKLPYLTWDEFDPYTNIQHGLMLAQRLLSKAPAGTKQIIMVSDGEPTAHIEGGQLFLQYPPSPRTIRETLREVRRCTSKGITINIFMLDRNSYLVEFVDQMTRINRGRVFYTSPERLGHYLLVDYVTSRRRVLY